MDRLTELILKEWVEFLQWKREWETLLLGIFLSSDRNLKRSDFDHLYHFKAKKTFFENWTSIKIKISSTCVYEEYEVKIKMVQEQWLQLKMKFYSVITWKLLSNGGINLW